MREWFFCFINYKWLPHKRNNTKGNNYSG